MLATETALWSVLVAHKMLLTHLGLTKYGYSIRMDRQRFAGYVAAVLVSREMWEPWEESAAVCFGRPWLSKAWRQQLPTGFSTRPVICDPDHRKASGHLTQYMGDWLAARDRTDIKTMVINTAAVWAQTAKLLADDTRCFITVSFHACAKANAGQLQERLCQIRHTPQQRRRLQ